jgi:uncharacterized protein with HEPN domain
LQRDPEAYLWDVVQAADDIAAFTAGLTEAAYLQSNITQAAVERKFEIIGEALNLLAKSNPEIASRIPDLAKIVGFRNLLIHGHAGIDQHIVWTNTRQSLLSLRKAAAELLDERG